MTVGSLAIRATRRPSIVAEAGDDAVGAQPLLVPVGEQRLLGEGAVVDQQRDPLADRQLALLGGLLVVALRAAGERRVQRFREVGHGESLFGLAGVPVDTGPARQSRAAPSGRGPAPPAPRARPRSVAAGRSRSRSPSRAASRPRPRCRRCRSSRAAPGSRRARRSSTRRTRPPPPAPPAGWPAPGRGCCGSGRSARPRSRRSRAAAKNSWTWRGFAIPVVSPKPTSSQPAAASRSAISKTRSGGTWPSYGQPKEVAITPSRRSPAPSRGRQRRLQPGQRLLDRAVDVRGCGSPRRRGRR